MRDQRSAWWPAPPPATAVEGMERGPAAQRCCHSSWGWSPEAVARGAGPPLSLVLLRLQPVVSQRYITSLHLLLSTTIGTPGPAQEPTGRGARGCLQQQQHAGRNRRGGIKTAGAVRAGKMWGVLVAEQACPRRHRWVQGSHRAEPLVPCEVTALAQGRRLPRARRAPRVWRAPLPGQQPPRAGRQAPQG